MSGGATAGDGLVRRAAQAVLRTAVRGRRERGGPWGEAVLGEFARTRGGWEAVRWAAGGLRTVWRERRARVRHLPRYDRIGRRVAALSVLGLIVAVPVNQFVVAGRYVPSTSMAPTLEINDRFLMDRLSFRITGLHLDDVVVYRGVVEGDRRARSLVGRVVGLPGDVVECRDGRVLRNGAALDERRAEPEPVDDCPRTVVPAGRLYLLGDNWQTAMDSRRMGTVERGAVQGRMLTRIWPVRRIGR